MVSLKPNRGVVQFLFSFYVSFDQPNKITITPKVRQKHSQVENRKPQNIPLGKFYILNIKVMH